MDRYARAAAKLFRVLLSEVTPEMRRHVKTRMFCRIYGPRRTAKQRVVKGAVNYLVQADQLTEIDFKAVELRILAHLNGGA